MKDRKRLFKYFLAYVFTIFSAVFAVIIYLKYFPVESKVITEKKTVNETKLSEVYAEVVEIYKLLQDVANGGYTIAVDVKNPSLKIDNLDYGL